MFRRVILPTKRQAVCPGGSTPLDFSARGSTNVLFHRFRFVLAIDTWKTRVGTLWHILALRIPVAGHFHLHVQESAKCYRPNVRKVTPGSHVLHHYTFHHTFTHILGPHARFGGIPMPRGTFCSETLICGPRIIYLPRCSSERGSPM